MAGGLATVDKSRPKKSSLRPKLSVFFGRKNLNLGKTEESPRWHPTPETWS